MKSISPSVRPGFRVWVGLSLIFCLYTVALSAAPKTRDIITTASANPVLTTRQVIEPAVLAQHRTATLLLLHINDVHDTINPPTNGLGGLAYVSGYVHQMRAQRKDLLMLDCGDWFQKGDRMGVYSKGETTARAFAGLSCDLTVPGNHDFHYGVEQYRRDVNLSGISVVCDGIEYADTHQELFAPYKIFQIGQLRVAVIGGTVNMNTPMDNGRAIRKFNVQELGKRMHEIAVELRPRVDLLMALVHMGIPGGKTLSRLAPEIQVFVCGHSHEVTEEPMVTPSGALILEAGHGGKWVGKLDAVVDRDEKKLGRYTYQLIPMDHKKIVPDQKLAALIQAMDKKWPAPARAARHRAAAAQGVGSRH